MKRLCVGITAVAALNFAASPAWALSISLDAPVSYQFNDGGAADSVSGFKVGLGLPLFPTVGVGFGYEGYEASLKEAGAASKVAFEIFDLFLEIPFPVVNLTIGAGWGSQEVTVAALNVKEDGNVSQAFVSLGYPVFPLIDFHLGYHAVKAEELKTTAGGVPFTIDASGQMWSLGVRVGF